MIKVIMKLLIVSSMMLVTCCGCSQKNDDLIIEGVLSQFQEFASIPRPSHQEEAISDYLVEWAKNRNLKVTQDSALNVIIDVPATKNMEDKALVALQAHMDMVFVCKDGMNLDPLTTKINTKIDGKYLASDGNTSLGADNGIGLAIALKIAEGEMAHGPLRLIITTDEEDSCSGVKALKSDVLENVSGIINMDSEEEGMVCVGCAEGDSITFNHIFHTSKTASNSSLKISLRGLVGGHSGLFIQENRGNAIRILMEALKALSNHGVVYELACFNGGEVQNVIPSSAEAVICVDAKDEAIDFIENYMQEQKEKYKQTDPDMVFEIEEIDKQVKVILEEDARSLVGFITEIPNGVYSWSKKIENFPESSNNIGVLRLSDDGALEVKLFARSSSVDKITKMNSIFKDTANKYGISEMEIVKLSGAWDYNLDSELLALTKEAYKKCFDEQIRVSSIHAGLECGTFVELKPDIDIISLGTTTYDVHSVDERCDTTSIIRVWKLIEEILKNR